MYRDRDVSAQEMIEFLNPKIECLESQVIGLQLSISESIRTSKIIILNELNSELGDTLDNLADHYIMKGVNSQSIDVYSSYMLKALMVNPDIEIKKEYNLSSSQIGVQLENQPNIMYLKSSKLVLVPNNLHERREALNDYRKILVLEEELLLIIGFGEMIESEEEYEPPTLGETYFTAEN